MADQFGLTEYCNQKLLGLSGWLHHTTVGTGTLQIVLTEGAAFTLFLSLSFLGAIPTLHHTIFR